MAWTQDDIDAIKSAIASGELRIRTSDGRMIEYRSMAELQRALQMVENEVNPSSVPSVRRLKTRGGFAV